jgi:formylglycine-generating enzyme required for sulfatase activity
MCGLFAAVALALLAGAASAQITIATVPVGNPGSPSEVDYTYNIGQYDVTSSQYTAFLNAVAANDTYGVYNSNMAGTTSGNPGIIQSGSSGSFTYSVAAGRDNNPVTDVTFWDACRFANWLDNGQPTGAEGPGTTETGTYTIPGIGGEPVPRNANYTWAVTSLSEWVKAAYYTPLGDAGNNGTSNYWKYPTQSQTISPTQANYYDSGINDTTPVGSYPYPSYYGTYDQAGNVWQWMDDPTLFPNIFYGCVLRGGAFDSSVSSLQAGGGTVPESTGFGSDEVGFRVSQVPEPASLGFLALAGTGMLVRRRGVRR